MELPFLFLTGLAVGFVAGLIYGWFITDMRRIERDYASWRSGFKDELKIYADVWNIPYKSVELTLQLRDHLHYAETDRVKYLETELAIAKIVYGTSSDSK